MILNDKQLGTCAANGPLCLVFLLLTADQGILQNPNVKQMLTTYSKCQQLGIYAHANSLSQGNMATIRNIHGNLVLYIFFSNPTFIT